MNPLRLRRRSNGKRSLLKKLFDLVLALAILFLLMVVLARVNNLGQQELHGHAEIVDGDTLELNGIRVRLREIDAPEYDQICRKQGSDYNCGREARDHLAKLVSSKPVTCAGWEYDQYDRLLAECAVAGGNLNRLMVEAGWAVAYGGYEGVEAMASSFGKGMWEGDFERPREWRMRRGDTADKDRSLVRSIWTKVRQLVVGQSGSQ